VARGRAALRRASLDLRHRTPSLDDFLRIDRDPDAYSALVDSYLREPAFGDAVADLFARPFRTRFEQYFHPFLGDYGLDDAYQRAVAEEPLRLLRAMALEDRPFSDLVTADTTFVDEHTARTWPVAGYDAARGGWQEVRYDDDRPPAGVLSMNALYFRYSSCGQNHHRGRANALSRMLLCDNYLKRPIDFPRDIDLTDEEGVRDAVRENPACVACHASLDPLASFLFGFANDVGDDPQPFYDPGMADGWRDATGLAPAFHGVPGDDLTDLGHAIADDPRFLRCATTRVVEGLFGRAVDVDAHTADGGFDIVTAHQQAFQAGGATLSALWRSVVHDAGYRGVDPTRDVTKWMSPEVFGDAVANLTGYRAVDGDVDVLRSDLTGLHVLGGGLDARSGDTPPAAPSPSRVLVWERVAEAAATHVVDAMAAGDGEHTGRFGLLLDGVDLDAAPPADVLRALVMMTAAPSNDDADDAVAALSALWAGVVDDGAAPREAWAAVLTASLRDAAFVRY
jgi:hypothetical protein